MNNPASELGEIEVLQIARKYGVSPSLVRPPLPNERVDGANPGEILVYEAFFALGFRGKVPSLIAELANIFSVSPGQFSPATWRSLVAIQVFGELHSFDIRAEEVLYAYFFKPHKNDVGTYSLNPRDKSSCLVFPLRPTEKRRIRRSWRKRYFFLKVCQEPGFPVHWFPADVSALRREEGKLTATKVFQHSSEHRFVDYLTSEVALENSAVWGVVMANKPLAKPDVFARWRLVSEAKRVETGKTLSPSASHTSGEEVQCIEIPWPSKRNHLDVALTSSTSKRRKAVDGSTKVAALPSTYGTLTVSDTSAVIEELKSKVFNCDSASLDAAGTAALSSQVYASLLKAMSAFHHVEGKVSFLSEDVKRECQVSDDLRRQLELEREKTSTAQAKAASHDLEIMHLKERAKDFEEIVTNLRAGTMSLEKERAVLAKDNVALRKQVGFLQQEVDLISTGTAIITRWEVLRECLIVPKEKWDLDSAEVQYKEVRKTQAELDGLPPPSFGEPLTALLMPDQDTSEPVDFDHAATVV